MHANDRFRLLRALELERLGHVYAPPALAAARAADEVRPPARPPSAWYGDALCAARTVLWASAAQSDAPVGRPRRPPPSAGADRPAWAHVAAEQALGFRFAFVHRARAELYSRAETRQADVGVRRQADAPAGVCPPGPGSIWLACVQV